MKRFGLLFCTVMMVVITQFALAGPASFSAMVTKVKSLKTYRAVIAINTEVAPVGGGQGTTISVTEKAAYQLPNKSSVITSGIMGNFIVICDGVHLYRYTDLSKQYTVSAAPKDFATLLLAGISDAKLTSAGVSKVGGVKVNVLKGTISSPRGTANVTLDIGISDSLPRMAVIVIPQMMSPRGAYRVTTTEVLSSQVVNAPILASTFKFIVPEGATQTNSPSGNGIGQMLGIPGMP